MKKASVYISALLLVALVYWVAMTMQCVPTHDANYTLSDELAVDYIDHAGDNLTLSRVVKKGKHPFTAGQVVAWADLDNALGKHLDRIECGGADGVAILGDYVLVGNAAEMVQFVRNHGYAKQLGIIRLRETDSTFYVDVEIEGKDGETLRVLLQSSGTEQGKG
ncbi:MAG TPA: hypothetical protein DCY41_08205 [Opitutae bacterium]|nr:hypothetical protein [Opitutae bacterium]